MLFIDGDTPGSLIKEFQVSFVGNEIHFSLAVEERSFLSGLSTNVNSSDLS